ncbi:TPA: lysis system i-spanin subunit Rz [Pseudomonas aeruginosa]
MITAGMRRWALFFVVGFAVSCGWLVNGWRLGAELAQVRAGHAAELQAIAETGAMALAEQQRARAALEARLAKSETLYYGKLKDAEKNTDRLVADLSAARQRLRVRTAPAACGDGVPAAAIAASLDDGGQRADIHPEDAAALVRITGEADACAVKLTALQEWARSVSAP